MLECPLPLAIELERINRLIGHDRWRVSKSNRNFQSHSKDQYIHLHGAELRRVELLVGYILSRQR